MPIFPGSGTVLFSQVNTGQRSNRFDGTVSLIRSGWFQIMTDMMIETLAGLNGGESESELRRSVEDSIWRLTGKDTIYQMMALADHVKIRGGNPLDTAVYMEDFQARVAAVTGPRIRALQTGACSPDCYLIPGTRNFLEALRARGLRLYLASGTLETCVKQECDLLDITRYFLILPDDIGHGDSAALGGGEVRVA